MGDLTLVVFQVSEAILRVLESESHSAHLMSLVRILRIFRVCRLSRLLHLVPDFRMLLVSILSSGRSLFWVFLLIGLVTYAFGIVITSIVTYHKVKLGKENM